MSLPKVSIITVVYNNQEHIQGAIQSVLKQDYSNIEYIESLMEILMTEL